MTAAELAHAARERFPALPAVADDPVYAEHWAGHRPVTVTVEAERIIITRTGEEPDDEDED